MFWKKDKSTEGTISPEEVPSILDELNGTNHWSTVIFHWDKLHKTPICAYSKERIGSSSETQRVYPTWDSCISCIRGEEDWGRFSFAFTFDKYVIHRYKYTSKCLVNNCRYFPDIFAFVWI